MKTSISVLLFAFSLFATGIHAEGNHAVGFGMHYWQVIEDIEVDNVEENGFSYIFAYQYDGGLLALQAEVEVFPEDFAGAPKDVYSPQALAILGENIYVGLGIGTFYSDGEFADDPFYFFRAGIALTGLGPVTLDLNANYIFSDFGSFEGSDIDTDTVTLGAMIRVDL
jgi:hypothetical protein